MERSMKRLSHLFARLWLGGATRASFGKPAKDEAPDNACHVKAQSDTGMEIISVHGLKAYIDRARDPEIIQRGLDRGWYEADEIALAREVLKAGDRVVELGAGMGLVTSAMATLVGADAVVAYEPNPLIAERARANLVLNGVSTTIREGVCRPRSVGSEAVDFRLAKIFWASSLVVKAEEGAPPRDEQVLKVPVEILEDVLSAHQANVLVMDIEGGELEILREADFSSLRVLIFETHEAMVGRLATNTAIQAACARGFLIDFSLTREGVVVLRREDGSPL